MKVALGKFARSAIETRLGTDVASGVQVALNHYARRLRSPWPPVGLPGFIRDRVPTEDPGVVFELSFDSTVRSVLQGEARKHGATMEQLVVHAVFIYLADLERPEAPQSTLGGAES
jgi:hypothetical protein